MNGNNVSLKCALLRSGRKYLMRLLGWENDDVPSHFTFTLADAGRSICCDNPRVQALCVVFCPNVYSRLALIQDFVWETFFFFFLIVTFVLVNRKKCYSSANVVPCVSPEGTSTQTAIVQQAGLLTASASLVSWFLNWQLSGFTRCLHLRTRTIWGFLKTWSICQIRQVGPLL